MCFKRNFTKLNSLLIPLIGAENVELWWCSNNRAFDNIPPIHFVRTDFNKVYEYLVTQYAGNYS